MPFLERDEELRIYYETWGEGEGPWVTLVNGYTRPMSDFKAMGRYLSERGFRVLAFDNRGTGKTDFPPGFSLEDIGEDITELWAHLKCGKSHLLGISYGGVVAATLAATRPAALRSLALVSTPLNEEYLSSESAGPSRNPKKFALELSRYFSPAFAMKNQMLVQGFIRQVARTFQEPETALGARAQRDSMEAFDLSALLANVNVPSLVVHGEADRIVSVESGKKIAAGLSDVRLELVPEVGHLLLVECPILLYEKIVTFFQGQGT